jgi:hypothetical protein
MLIEGEAGFRLRTACGTGAGTGEPVIASGLRRRMRKRIVKVKTNIPVINLQLLIKTDNPSNNTFMGTKD